MKRAIPGSESFKDGLAALATENIILSNKWKRTALVPAIIGLAITGVSEIISYNIPGLAQYLCGCLGLAPLAAGIFISMVQAGAADDLNDRAQTGLMKSLRRTNIAFYDDQEYPSDN